MNVEQEARFEESEADSDDIVPELGEVHLEDRLELLRDSELFADDAY